MVFQLNNRFISASYSTRVPLSCNQYHIITHKNPFKACLFYKNCAAIQSLSIQQMRLIEKNNPKRLVIILKSVFCTQKNMDKEMLSFSGVVFVRSNMAGQRITMRKEPIGHVSDGLCQTTD